MPPKVTVIMRTKNSAASIVHALSSLFSQHIHSFDLVVVDSGSTDETLELVGQFPCRVLHVAPESYFPGPVLNWATEQTDGDVVIFQNSDVLLLAPDCLEALLEPLDRPEVQATFARQVPRPEAHPWVQRDYETAFPTCGDSPDWLPLSLPLAAVRRSALKLQPFYSEAWGSEDTHWGERAKARGWEVVYTPRAVVMHSHNYTVRQLYGRRFIEGEADAFIYGDELTLPIMVGRIVKSFAADMLFQLRRLDLRGLTMSPIRRSVYHWGYLKGHRLGTRRRAGSDANASIGQQAVLSRYD